MFIGNQPLRVWLYTPPTDMRKSFVGLCALVKTKLDEDPLSGQLFAFVNRKKTYMKVLYFNRGGYCIWSKKLIQGQFNHRQGEGDKHALDLAQLSMLIEGIEARDIRRYKRYERAPGTCSSYNKAHDCHPDNHP